ncbi:hypothetical protein GF312_09450 [Candidatus Poribacteria bacterium]|nr:hypothetical protein [Candidatus Poribacteria bacterium]
MKRLSILLLIACFVFVFSAVKLQAAELMAAWSFDNDTDEDVTDVTGNGHDGVGVNTVIVDGKFGKAMEFDGETSRVEIEHDEVLNFTDGVTVEAWVNPSGFNDLSAVAQKWGDASNRRQYLLCFVADKVRFYMSGVGNTWPSAESTSQVPTGEWTHIAGTYDGETIRVFINGEMETETNNAETNQGLFGSDIPVWIGGYGPDDEFAGNRHYPGIVDEVRFWDNALSEDEIQAGMNRSTANITAVSATDKLCSVWAEIKK